jgi:hypothetical protein
LEPVVLVDEHEEPSATHMPLKQHPLEHWLPAQQGSPVSPQTWQMPVVDVDEHTLPDTQRSVPLAPAQHCSPALPHDEHTPLRQARPEPQVVPQQGWPAAPQPEHFPPPHTPGPPPLPPVPRAVEPHAVPSPTHISL